MATKEQFTNDTEKWTKSISKGGKYTIPGSKYLDRPIEITIPNLKNDSSGWSDNYPICNLYNHNFRTSSGIVSCNNGTATESDGAFTLVASGTDLFLWTCSQSTGASYSSGYGPLIEIPSSATQMHFKVSDTRFTKNYITYWDSSKKTLNTSYVGVGQDATIQVSSFPSGTKYVSFRIGYGNATSGTTYTIKVMVNWGSSAQEWIKYVESKASSFSMTGSAVTDAVTVGTLSGTNYSISAKVKGTVSASYPGTFGNSGAVQASTATQVGTMAAAGVTVSGGGLSGGGLTAGNGEVSITTTPAVTPSIGGTGVSSTSQTNYGITTTKPASGTDGTNYLTFDPDGTVATKGKAKGRGSVSRAAVTRAAIADTYTAGYLPSRTATNRISADSTTIGATTGTSNWSAESEITPTINGGTNWYIPIVVASASATNGTASIKTQPSASASLTRTGDIGTTTKPSSGTAGTDYWTFTSSASANSGVITATGGSASASVGKGVTAGSSTGTKTGTTATSTAATASDSSSVYLPKATFTRSGGNINVSTAGYIASGTVGTVTAANLGLTSDGAATTVYATTSDQTVISANHYRTGAVTLSKLSSTNYSAGNIKYNTTITVNNGSANVYSVKGTFTSSTTVSSGQTAAAAGQLLTGYSAWVNGAEVKGSIPIKGQGQYVQSGGKSSAVTDTVYFNIPWGYYAKENDSSTTAYVYAGPSIVGNAAAANVLSGKTFTSGVAGLKVSGTMTNNARVGLTNEIGLTTNDEIEGDDTYLYFRLAEGYYPATAWRGTILSNLGTATVAQVLSGSTFTSTAGLKVSGTMTNNGALGTTASPKTITAQNGTYTIPAGYTSGGVVKATLSNATISNVGNTTTDKSSESGYIPLVSAAGYTAKRWMNSLTVPASKTLSSITLTAGTSDNRTYLTTLTVNGYSTVSNLVLNGIITSIAGSGNIDQISNTGPTNYVSASATAGSLTVNAYDNASTPALTGAKTVVSGGKWNSTTCTTATNNGYYYGRVYHYKTTTSNISAANIKHGVVVTVGDSASSTRVANVTGSFYNDGTTYTLSSVGTSIDMGATSSNRYITTSGLQVIPTATYTASAAVTNVDITGYGKLTISGGTITANTTLASGATANSTKLNKNTYIKIGKGYYASDTYYQVNNYTVESHSAGTVTTNVASLPNGVSSSGTINRGTYIKIGAGAYSADKYYYAQADAHSAWSPSTSYYTTTNTGYGAVTANAYTPSSAYYIKKATSAAGPASSAISVGKENLLTSPHDLVTSSWNKEANVTVAADTDGYFKVTVAAAASNNRWGIYQDYSLAANTSYTLTVTGKGTATQLSVGLSTAGTWGSSVHTFTSGGDTYSYTFNSGSNTVLRVYLCLSKTASTDTIGYFKRPVLSRVVTNQIPITTISTSAPSSGYNIPVCAIAGGQSKITEAGWIGTGNLPMAGASAYEYINIPGGTITPNTTLASGATANSTKLNKNTYIKIGKGYYASDAYYQVNNYTEESHSAGTITPNTTLASGATANSTKLNKNTYIKIGKGSYANDVYYQVNDYTVESHSAGTVTTNVASLPSGVSSSGTINRGTYIKIGAGAYSADKYYYAQADAHSEMETQNLTLTNSTTNSGTNNIQVIKTQGYNKSGYIYLSNLTVPNTYGIGTNAISGLSIAGSVYGSITATTGYIEITGSSGGTSVSNLSSGKNVIGYNGTVSALTINAAYIGYRGSSLSPKTNTVTNLYFGERDYTPSSTDARVINVTYATLCGKNNGIAPATTTGLTNQTYCNYIGTFKVGESFDSQAALIDTLTVYGAIRSIQVGTSTRSGTKFGYINSIDIGGTNSYTNSDYWDRVGTINIGYNSTNYKGIVGTLNLCGQINSFSAINNTNCYINRMTGTIWVKQLGNGTTYNATLKVDDLKDGNVYLKQGTAPDSGYGNVYFTQVGGSQTQLVASGVIQSYCRLAEASATPSSTTKLEFSSLSGTPKAWAFTVSSGANSLTSSQIISARCKTSVSTYNGIYATSSTSTKVGASSSFLTVATTSNSITFTASGYTFNTSLTYNLMYVY